MPQDQDQRSGVMQFPVGDPYAIQMPGRAGQDQVIIPNTASAFDPGGGGFPKATLPSKPMGQTTASQAFSPDVDKDAQGNLPSGGGAQDTFAALNALLGKDTIGEAELMKALTPVAGAAPVQMPPYFTRQLPQPGALIQDTRPVVGAGNARAQGIGNSINAVIHGIAQFKSQRDQTQQTVDATKVQRLIEVQNGISQAEQTLRMTQDPAIRAEAQRTLEHNQGLMAQMLSDKKFSKLVEKGFNISLTDPSANKTPEHGAVQKGIDMFKKANNQPYTPEQAKAMAQKFQAAQPQQLGPNVVAQQMLQYKMLEQQQWQKFAAAMLPRIFSANSAMERAQYQAGVREFLQTREFAFKANAAGAKIAADQNMAWLRHTYRSEEITQHVNESMHAMYQLFQDKSLDPTTLFKLKSDFTNKFAANEARFRAATAQILQAIAAAQAAKAASTDKNEKAAMDLKIQDMQKQYESIMVQQSNYESYKDSFFNQMQRLEELSGGGGGQSGPGSQQQPPTGGPGGGGAYNPQSLLNDVPAGVQQPNPGSGALPPASGGGAASSPRVSGDPFPEDNPDEDDEDLEGVYSSPF